MSPIQEVNINKKFCKNHSQMSVFFTIASNEHCLCAPSYYKPQATVNRLTFHFPFFPTK